MAESIGGGWRRAGPLAAALGVVLAGAARADRIVLRGGGEIKGVVLPDKAHPDQVQVQTETGPRPLVFPRSRVVQVIDEPGALDEYLRRKDRVAETATAQYELGLWCEARKLTGPAEVHFRRAVALDPAFGPAHKKLGHVQHGDRWMTYDESRVAQGLIKYKGRWVSRQEKDLLDAKATLSAEQQSWARQLKILRSAVLNGPEPKRSQAEAQLIAIRDPAAVQPLVQAFVRDPEPVRALLVRVLGGIDGPEAAAALLDRVLSEADTTVRSAALDELARRKEPDTVTKLLRALKATDMAVVGRAAWALAALRVTSAVPKLLPVLMQSEQHLVLDPAGSAGVGGGGMSAGFSSVLPGPGATGGIPAHAPPGFSYVRSYPILTGPVVAPGVVAYGATSLPYGSPAFTFGSGVDANRPVPRVVTILRQNGAVLEALESLTGQNLGYDVAAWKHWLNSSPPPQRGPARKVPQP